MKKVMLILAVLVIVTIIAIPLKLFFIGEPLDGELVIDELICDNPKCISSTEQELKHMFRLVNPEMGIYRCVYCEAKKVRGV